jgi:hypothetical protein
MVHGWAVSVAALTAAVSFHCPVSGFVAPIAQCAASCSFAPAVAHFSPYSKAVTVPHVRSLRRHRCSCSLRMATSIEVQPGCLIMFERSSGDQVSAALQQLKENTPFIT